MRRIGSKRRSEPRGKLRELSAWELLQARQEASTLAQEETAFGLCLNACVLARALVRCGRPVYVSAEAALKRLGEAGIRTGIERYLARFSAQEATVVNPAFDQARYEELRGL